MRGRGMQPGKVAVDEPDHDRARTLDAGEHQIAAAGDLPRVVDHGFDRPEESERVEPVRSAGQLVAQLRRFDRRHRHALAVHRVEAGERVADDQETGGKARSRSYLRRMLPGKR